MKRGFTKERVVHASDVFYPERMQRVVEIGRKIFKGGFHLFASHAIRPTTARDTAVDFSRSVVQNNAIRPMVVFLVSEYIDRGAFGDLVVYTSVLGRKAHTVERQRHSSFIFVGI
jgi:hypothetical protein